MVSKIYHLFLQVRSSGSPLSPFLYAATAGASGGAVPGDPMSSPPPAHMGTYLDKSTIGTQRYVSMKFVCRYIVDVEETNIKLFCLYLFRFEASNLSTTNISVPIRYAWSRPTGSMVIHFSHLANFTNKEYSITRNHQDIYFHSIRLWNIFCIYHHFIYELFWIYIPKFYITFMINYLFFLFYFILPAFFFKYYFALILGTNKQRFAITKQKLL